jgi:hypothetical protein
MVVAWSSNPTRDLERWGDPTAPAPRASHMALPSYTMLLMPYKCESLYCETAVLDFARKHPLVLFAHHLRTRNQFADTWFNPD